MSEKPVVAPSQQFGKTEHQNRLLEELYRSRHSPVVTLEVDRHYISSRQRGYSKSYWQAAADWGLIHNAEPLAPQPTNFWFDEAELIDEGFWTKPHPAADEFRKNYLQEYVPAPWAEAGNDLKRMVADGLTRTQIRKNFLRYYPTMTNRDVNKMFENYERDHGEITDHRRVR